MLLILNEQINSYVSLSVISKFCFSVVVPQTKIFSRLSLTVISWIYIALYKTSFLRAGEKPISIIESQIIKIHRTAAYKEENKFLDSSRLQLSTSVTSGRCFRPFVTYFGGLKSLDVSPNRMQSFLPCK